MNIYGYDDFRLFLRDAFEEKKRQEPNFTHRRFSELAGVKNPGYLLDIIKGKRKLSLRLRDKSVEIFGLKPAEIDFFHLLVRYGQSRSLQEKEDLYKELVTRRNHSSFVRLDPARTRYFEDNNYALVLAGAEACNFQGDFERLGEFLDPPIPAFKVKKYVNELCEWGLLQKRDDGVYEVVNRFLEPPATMGGSVRRLNRQWVQHVPDALMRLPASQRHVSTLLLTISDKTREQLMEKVEQFRREVIELAKKDDNPQNIMQLSLAYYPRSRKQNGYRKSK